MKKVGLIGGISWVSTVDYYRFINEGINARLGGLNFAECLIYSLNFADVQAATWNHSFDLLANACIDLKKAGATAIALCANTAHMYADGLANHVELPFIHIAEATAKTINKGGLKKVALLGTQFTMEMPFYRDKLASYGLEVLIPELKATRDYLQYTIKEELGTGLLRPETKAEYLKIMDQLVANGAEGIILGCTEIPLLIKQADYHLPLFDTTQIHSVAIVDYMLAK
jgi:aspartate racemase